MEHAREIEPFHEPADEVRSYVQQLVTDRCDDIFPVSPFTDLNRNNVFVRGRNILERTASGEEQAHMVVLQPDGAIESGVVVYRLVRQRMDWDFESATIQPAADEEVVEYGPLLVSELFRKVAEQTYWENKPERIKSMLDFLELKFDAVLSIINITEPVLKTTYGDEYAYPNRGHDEIERFGILSPSIYMLLLKPEMSTEEREAQGEQAYSNRSLRTAFELYENRQEILAHINHLDKVNGAQAVQEALQDLIKSIVEADIFPLSSVEVEGTPFVWAGRVQGSEPVDSSFDTHLWAVFRDGAVHIKSPSDDRTFVPDPEQLSSQAVEIADKFIQQVVSDRFVRLCRRAVE